MKISLILILVLVVLCPLSKAFEVTITCDDAKAPVVKDSVIVTISFEKYSHYKYYYILEVFMDWLLDILIVTSSY